MVEELKRLADIISDVADDLSDEHIDNLGYAIASIRLDSVLFHLNNVNKDIADKSI